MEICGIVAEYNPFHNGHAALVERARNAGVSHIVAVMSGNFVQRADFAAADKRLRAACALQGGVDLVVELPLAWATASAEGFARGAVGLLAALGCVGHLAFGSECADPARLAALARAVDDERVRTALREELAQGVGFAVARQRALASLLGADAAQPLSSPNDVLGVEYLRQARALGFAPRIHAVRRLGAGHDAETPRGRYASASYLRTHAHSRATLRRYVPVESARLLDAARADGRWPADAVRLERAVLAQLRRLDRESLAALPDVSEGLDNRLYAAIRAAGSMDELLAALRTKRYPHSRVRRLVLSAFLGLRREDGAGLPPYLRVIGFNARGREILAAAKACALPLSPSLVKLAREGAVCARTAQLEAQATDLWSLALEQPYPCGWEYSASGVFLKA